MFRRHACLFNMNNCIILDSATTLLFSNNVNKMKNGFFTLVECPVTIMVHGVDYI